MLIYYRRRPPHYHHLSQKDPFNAYKSEMHCYLVKTIRIDTIKQT
jgi:hypothetical protein